MRASIMFKKPDRQGWFDYEKCPVCGEHYRQCTCGREKSDLEQKLEIASQADIITPIAAMMGIQPGCIIILWILIMALVMMVFGGD
jgi:hypothetical protein